MYKRQEYILVDGASKDGTLSIIDRYRDRITRIVSEPDKGCLLYTSALTT